MPIPVLFLVWLKVYHLVGLLIWPGGGAGEKVHGGGSDGWANVEIKSLPLAWFSAPVGRFFCHDSQGGW